MADETHFALLCRGATVWNAWRQAEPGVVPDLDGATFPLSARQWGPAQGGPVDLSGARLGGTMLDHATLIGADLRGADLTGASLVAARLEKADLRGASLAYADCDQMDFADADVTGADLTGARLATARNVLQSQVDGCRGDAATALPPALVMPAHWTRPAAMAGAAADWQAASARPAPEPVAPPPAPVASAAATATIGRPAARPPLSPRAPERQYAAIARPVPRRVMPSVPAAARPAAALPFAPLATTMATLLATQSSGRLIAAGLVAAGVFVGVGVMLLGSGEPRRAEPLVPAATRGIEVASAAPARELALPSAIELAVPAVAEGRQAAVVAAAELSDAASAAAVLSAPALPTAPAPAPLPGAGAAPGRVLPVSPATITAAALPSATLLPAAVTPAEISTVLAIRITPAPLALIAPATAEVASVPARALSPAQPRELNVRTPSSLLRRQAEQLDGAASGRTSPTRYTPSARRAPPREYTSRSNGRARYGASQAPAATVRRQVPYGPVAQRGDPRASTPRAVAPTQSDLNLRPDDRVAAVPRRAGRATGRYDAIGRPLTAEEIAAGEGTRVVQRPGEQDGGASATAGAPVRRIQSYDTPVRRMQGYDAPVRRMQSYDEPPAGTMLRRRASEPGYGRAVPRRRSDDSAGPVRRPLRRAETQSTNLAPGLRCLALTPACRANSALCGCEFNN